MNLIPIILQALPSVVTGVEHLIAYIAAVRAQAKQDAEWTEEHEAQFLAGLAAHNIDPAYLPDAAQIVRPPTVPPMAPG